MLGRKAVLMLLVSTISNFLCALFSVFQDVTALNPRISPVDRLLTFHEFNIIGKSKVKGFKAHIRMCLTFSSYDYDKS